MKEDASRCSRNCIVAGVDREELSELSQYTVQLRVHHLCCRHTFSLWVIASQRYFSRHTTGLPTWNRLPNVTARER